MCDGVLMAPVVEELSVMRSGLESSLEGKWLFAETPELDLTGASTACTYNH